MKRALVLLLPFIAGAKPAGFTLEDATIFGQCTNIDIIHNIASAATGPNDRPLVPIKINTIAVTRK